MHFEMLYIDVSLMKSSIISIDNSSISQNNTSLFHMKLSHLKSYYLQ